MPFRCNPSEDLPSATKTKRIIFYGKGLKIYGTLPYLLSRRLKAEFYSNNFVQSGGAFRGMGLIAPAYEANYTVVPYTQRPQHASALLNWLLSDAGFEWAIAVPGEFDKEIRCTTAFSSQDPEVWVPDPEGEAWREGFLKAMHEGSLSAIQNLFAGEADVGQ